VYRLPQLADIRDHFDQATQTEPANILESRDVDGPLILDASETPPDLDSILSDIPPKDITSKLVSRYFNGVEFPTGNFLRPLLQSTMLKLAVVIIHTPTFDQEVRIAKLSPLQAADDQESIAISGSIPKRFPFHGSACSLG